MDCIYDSAGFYAVSDSVDFWSFPLKYVFGTYAKGDKWNILGAPGKLGLLPLGDDYEDAKVFVDFYDGRELYYYYTEDPEQPFGMFLGTREIARTELRAAIDFQRAKKARAEKRVVKAKVALPTLSEERLEILREIQGD